MEGWVRPMPAPEEMPKRTAKAMVADWPVPGSQRARIRAVVSVLIRIIMLKWPNLSARALGIVRPIMLFGKERI